MTREEIGNLSDHIDSAVTYVIDGDLLFVHQPINKFNLVPLIF